MEKKQIMITAGIGLFTFVLGFFGGTMYQKQSSPIQNDAIARTRNFENGATGGTNSQNRNTMRPIIGEILAIDAQSITVKLADGSSKIVVTSPKTTAIKNEKVELKDLKSGEKIGVFGSENADGSVNALSVQINPETRSIGGFGVRDQQTTGGTGNTRPRE